MGDGRACDGEPSATSRPRGSLVRRWVRATRRVVGDLLQVIGSCRGRDCSQPPPARRRWITRTDHQLLGLVGHRADQQVRILQLRLTGEDLAPARRGAARDVLGEVVEPVADDQCLELPVLVRHHVEVRPPTDQLLPGVSDHRRRRSGRRRSGRRRGGQEGDRSAHERQLDLPGQRCVVGPLLAEILGQQWGGLRG